MQSRVCALIKMREPTLSNAGHLFASGTTVPADGSYGYQTGCIFQKTDGTAGSTLYVNEGSVTSCDFNRIGANIDGPLYLDKTSTLRIGDWVIGGATTGGVPLTNDYDTYGDGQIDILQVHGVSTTSVGSNHSAKCGRFRHLVNVSGTIETETYGLIGQLVVKDTTLGHLHAGIMGTFEGHTSGVVINGGYIVGAACITARLGGHTYITATDPIAGFLAFNNASAALASGNSCAFATSMASASYPWTVGIYMPVGSVSIGMRIGNWVTAGGTGGAIPFSTAQNFNGDGQLGIVSCFGESTSDLTNAYQAHIGRFRHLVSGSATTIAHETYGLLGQVVTKSVVLTHMHAGLMGTVEGNTTACTFTPAYRYGVAGVISRLGGLNLITTSTPIAGFSAVFNSAALVSGTSVAFAATTTSTGKWDYLLGVKHSGSGDENGVNIASITGGPTDGSADGVLKVDVGGTPYYVLLHTADHISGE